MRKLILPASLLALAALAIAATLAYRPVADALTTRRGIFGAGRTIHPADGGRGDDRGRTTLMGKPQIAGLERAKPQ